MEIPSVLARFSTRPEGLTSDDARARRAQYGPNVLARDQRTSLGRLFWLAVLNPLVILLAILATISFATGDPRAGIVMSLMIALGVSLRLIQEAKADSAAAKLKAMISVTATAIRDGKPHEIAVSQLVPGDVVKLAAGDMIPADVRMVAAKDLFVTQGALTGESFPVEKFEVERNAATTAPIDLTTIAFLGTSVESGSATAVVVATGKETFLGSMAQSLSEEPDTDRVRQGHRSVHLADAPLHPRHGAARLRHQRSDQGQLGRSVLLRRRGGRRPHSGNAADDRDGLPVQRRDGDGRKKVIVKRINAIQNLGAMDVLCTDKTGTLTMDHVILEQHCDVVLKEDEGVLALAYLNSHFQTGLRNVMDRAVLAHTGDPPSREDSRIRKGGRDPVRLPAAHHVGRGPYARRQGPNHQQGSSGGHLPALHELRARRPALPDGSRPHRRAQAGVRTASADGFRVLAIASKDVEPRGIVAGDALPTRKPTSAT